MVQKFSAEANMQLQPARYPSQLHSGRSACDPTKRPRKAVRRKPEVIPNLWHVQYKVGEYPTELWGLQATQTAQAQVLVVGGNPGLAAFYRQFMLELQGAFGGAADVISVSHVGHDADNLSRGSVWCLDSQIQHKVQLLQELLTPDKPPTVIVAHSIGSYIMLQALKRYASVASRSAPGTHTPGLQAISKVFLLMPFLTTDMRSWEQRVLAAAARHHGPRLAAAAAGVLQQCPVWLQEGVVDVLLGPGAEGHAADSLRAGLNPPGLMNNWHLAAHEFSVLAAPVDWSLMQRLGSKACVVYNPSDPWFQQYDELRSALPDVEAYADSGLSHAFCLSTAECRVVAQLVARSATQQAAAAAASGSVKGYPGAAASPLKTPAFNTP